MQSDAFESETTLSLVEQQWTADGWPEDFLIRSGGKVYCPGHDLQVPASELVVDRMRRFEGASSPEDEQMLFAVHHGEGDDACRGTLAIGYGTAATPDDVQVLEDLDVEGAEAT